MGNESAVQHNIALKDPGGSLSRRATWSARAAPRSSPPTVKAGKYIYLCTVPGHEAGGMKGELTVK